MTKLTKAFADFRTHLWFVGSLLAALLIVLNAVDDNSSGTVKRDDEIAIEFVHAAETVVAEAEAAAPATPEALSGAVCLDYTPAKPCACDEVSPVTNQCAPGGFFADIGTEITRDHPLYADDPPAHDPSHDSRPLARDIPWSPSEVDGGVLATVRAAKKFYPTHDDLLQAHDASWLKNARPVLANNAGTTISKAAFLEVLPHIPFANARYVATATDDTPKYECLDYANDFKAFTVALGIYPSGQVFDFQGGHSYSAVLVFNEADAKFDLLVIEPQGNVIVRQAYPDRHYTGTGEVWYY